jgi:hypothetical protein
MDERNKKAGDQEVHLIPAQRMSGRGALGLGTLGHRVGKKKGKGVAPVHPRRTARRFLSLMLSGITR